MDWQGLGSVIGGIVAVFGGIRRFSGKAGRMRTRIEHDLELMEKLNKLEPTSLARIQLQHHIERSVRNLVTLEKDEDSRRTDPYGLIWCMIFLGLAIAAGVTALRTHYHWWIDLGLWTAVAILIVLTM